MTDQKQIDKETELNVFARFFGSLLTQLRHHNLRHDRQSHAQPEYIQEPTIDSITYIR
jgi:hypothetical protein